MGHKWSEAQCRRLAIERGILREFMPHYKFYDPRANTYVMGWQPTSQGIRAYQVMVMIPPRYPDVYPPVYILTPNPLPIHGGGFINSFENSHAYHTLEKGPSGSIQVCHDFPSDWNPSKTICSVLSKVLLWLEAYEGHFATGKDIHYFFKNRGCALEKWIKNKRL